MADAPYLPHYLDLGRSVAVALSNDANWKHRKVESLRLLEGEFGRRRVSIDCTPPRELVVNAPEGTCLVPLAFLEKEPLRQLDVTDSAGQSLPVLGRADDGFLALCALTALVTDQCGECLPKLGDLLDTLVFGDATSAREAHAELQSDHLPALRTAGLNPGTEQLITKLVDSFMLVVAIPKDMAGRRQVLKYSYHWTIDFPTRSEQRRLDPRRYRDWLLWWFDRFSVAFGFRAGKLAIPSYGLADAQSYHLEVQAPIELLCVRLTLPNHEAVSPHADDTDTTVVAHAVASYDSVDDSAVSRLEVVVPKRGVRMSTWLVATFAATVFILEETLPNARAALLEGADGAGALLIVVPAALFAFAARPQENALSSYFLLPLRMSVLLCSALLLLGAASLVGGLHEPWIERLWLGSAVITGLLSIVQGFSLRFVRI